MALLCLISNTMPQLEQSCHQQFCIIVTFYRPPAITISYSTTSPEKKNTSSNRLGTPLGETSSQYEHLLPHTINNVSPM